MGLEFVTISYNDTYYTPTQFPEVSFYIENIYTAVDMHSHGIVVIAPLNVEGKIKKDPKYF